MGVWISKAIISRIITKNNDLFHEEKSEIFLSGLNSTTYQQIDDTSARVNGNNWYTQIICNPYYTVYITVPHKNRETILDILLCGNEKTYCFNEEAFELMETFNIPQLWLEKLSSSKGKTYNNEEMSRKMDCVFSSDVYKSTKMRVLEACSRYGKIKDLTTTNSRIITLKEIFAQINYCVCNYRSKLETVY